MTLEALSLSAQKNFISSAKTHEQFWLDHFTKHKRSGMSRKQYCREHHIVYNRFQYWHHKLVGAKKENVSHQPVAKSNKPVLLPLTVDAAKTPTSSHLAACRIRLSGGHEVVVENEATAVVLFKELLSCSSR